MKAEELVSGALLALLLLYVTIANPDIFKITRIGYSTDFGFEDKPYFIWTIGGWML